MADSDSHVTESRQFPHWIAPPKREDDDTTLTSWVRGVNRMTDAPERDHRGEYLDALRKATVILTETRGAFGAVQGAWDEVSALQQQHAGYRRELADLSDSPIAYGNSLQRAYVAKRKAEIERAIEELDVQIATATAVHDGLQARANAKSTQRDSTQRLLERLREEEMIRHRAPVDPPVQFIGNTDNLRPTAGMPTGEAMAALEGAQTPGDGTSSSARPSSAGERHNQRMAARKPKS